MKKWEYCIVNRDETFLESKRFATSLNLLAKNGWRVVPISIGFLSLPAVLMEREIPEPEPNSMPTGITQNTFFRPGK